MNRGDVYLADLEPVRGSEANKIRPVILVGNRASLDGAARLGRGVVSVIPCTPNLSVHGPMHVVLRPNRTNGLTVASKSQAEQIRSIALGRLIKPVGRLGSADLDAVDRSLRFHLAL